MRKGQKKINRKGQESTSRPPGSRRVASVAVDARQTVGDHGGRDSDGESRRSSSGGSEGSAGGVAQVLDLENDPDHKRATTHEATKRREKKANKVNFDG